MIINELLGRSQSDTSYPIEVGKQNFDYSEYIFFSNSKRYVVVISEMEDDIIEVVFGPKLINYINYEIEPLNNMKETIKIFTTVIEACKLYNEKHHPLVWVFSAKESSRIKLYRRLAKTLANTFNLKYQGRKMSGENMFILYQDTHQGRNLVYKFARNIGNQDAD
jgi:hypothetical protein